MSAEYAPHVMTPLATPPGLHTKLFRLSTGTAGVGAGDAVGAADGDEPVESVAVAVGDCDGVPDGVCVDDGTGGQRVTSDVGTCVVVNERLERL